METHNSNFPLFPRRKLELAAVLCLCDRSMQEAETGGLPWVSGQLKLPTAFKASLGYIVRLCFKINKQMNKKSWVLEFMFNIKLMTAFLE